MAANPNLETGRGDLLTSLRGKRPGPIVVTDCGFRHERLGQLIIWWSAVPPRRFAVIDDTMRRAIRARFRGDPPSHQLLLCADVQKAPISALPEPSAAFPKCHGPLISAQKHTSTAGTGVLSSRCSRVAAVSALPVIAPDGHKCSMVIFPPRLVTQTHRLLARPTLEPAIRACSIQPSYVAGDHDVRSAIVHRGYIKAYFPSRHPSASRIFRDGVPDSSPPQPPGRFEWEATIGLRAGQVTRFAADDYRPPLQSDGAPGRVSVLDLHRGMLRRSQDAPNFLDVSPRVSLST